MWRQGGVLLLPKKLHELAFTAAICERKALALRVSATLQITAEGAFLKVFQKLICSGCTVQKILT